jgi:tetratricopeptide (TPR) repeat protein
MRSNRGGQDEESDEKVRAYDGKDYTEDIEFPVELVDRDGVVRRYSYEESLAVYHRRIQSAPWRYGEDELIRAEIYHCTRRIDQIKRSYQRRSRGGEAGPTNARAALGEAFEPLREHYLELIRERRLRLDGEFSFRVSLIDDQPTCRVYHLGFGAGRGGHLVYVYPFDRRGDDEPRRTFEAARDAFRGVLAGDGVERLLLVEEGRGAGYLLTGATEFPEGLQALCTRIDDAPGEGEDGSQPWWLGGPQPEEEPDEPDGGAFEAGVNALREEDADGAAACFRDAVEENPFHREAYLALLGVLDGSERYEEASLYAEMALRNLPDDALIRYRQGISLVRLGRLREAVAVFDEAAAGSPALHQPSYFAAHVLLARGRDLDGAHRRLRRAVGLAPDEEQVVEALATVERALMLRRVLRAIGAGGLLLAGLGLAWGVPGAPLEALAGALLVATAGPLASAAARWRLQRRSGQSGE